MEKIEKPALGDQFVRRALDALHGATGLSEFAIALIEQLALLVPSELISFFEIDLLAGAAHPLRFSHAGPRGFASLRGRGSVVGSSGAPHQFTFLLSTRRPLAVGIAMQRSDHGFSEDEIALVVALQPSLAVAFDEAMERGAPCPSPSHKADRRRAGASGSVDRRAGEIPAADRHAGGNPAVDRRHMDGNPTVDRGAGASGAVERRRAAGNPTVDRPAGASGAAERRRAGASAAVDLRRVGSPTVDRRGTPIVDEDRRPDLAGLLATLTPRENQVARLIAEGCSNRQIARSLTISQRTAESHVARVLHKLGVPSRGGVIAQFTQALRG